jgi:gliding motility-associated-like protein
VASVANDDDSTTKDGIPTVIRVLDNDNVGPSGSPFDPATIEIVSQPAHGTVTVNADGTITYVNTPGYAGVDLFTYRVRDENGVWSNVATVNIAITKNEIHVPNVMTPNGDGRNDKLIISGLEKYQANQLLIFNRWNNKVYESKNYKGDWDGKRLNSGTYFYTLKLQDKNGQWQTVNGYITLIR